ncbi:MAG: hypothetical protein N3A66_06665, partial [Planctomycetota bacterium]|nr:hypothetical protein [Planctomycetota bacterium]
MHLPLLPEISDAGGNLVSILGVVYVHRKTSDGGDIYLTSLGLRVADLLAIENWYERQWFKTHRVRLEGTSAVFRVPTRPVNGRSMDLVVKNSRVGEDVPLDTRTLAEYINAEFNSPWEEFALVMELRDGRYGPAEIRIHTQEPLAIYVPPEELQIWQTGRSLEKINKINAQHPGVELDILRQYKMVYGWLAGHNAVEVCHLIGLSAEEMQSCLVPITARVIANMERKGYAMADMKPQHIILPPTIVERLRQAAASHGPPQAAALLAEAIEQGEYAVVDYELLRQTPQHEAVSKAQRRHSYLDDVRDRFQPTPLPPHLRAVEILGVPYIWGHVESTGGQLYVVGRNARLFDYFLPERWRKTPHRRLSVRSEVYYTLTKDNVHLVWKTSRVGENPSGFADPRREAAARALGFASPFEEFALAQYLSDRGVPVVYMRAIYMTGTPKIEPVADARRFESHRRLRSPDNGPLLQKERNYIMVRGFYNGPDSWVALHGVLLYKPIDLAAATAAGWVSKAQAAEIYDRVLRRLRALGCDGSLLEEN